MAGDGYKVDLSALDQVIKKLNGVIGDLGKTSADTKHNTYLPKGALGTGFDEAQKLSSAHDEMKTYLEAVVDHLESVMDDFGTKTKKAHGAYQDAEADTASSVHGASTASTSGSSGGNYSTTSGSMA
ncbi:hypothetical protein ABT127_16865 [Streptomyces sp. NPDC001904]|uniref:hypothetical protein n=1 Tax=Streptomyces sp. NPDC001904 TaxID=3154531 RepID=UPI0033194612